MRRDSFAAGFWCALVVVALILVARREEEQRPQVMQPLAAPIVAARFVAPPPAAPELPPLRPVQEAAAYTGNASTHRFHSLSCRYASCSNCTVRFATREEAIAAGFRPGGCCNP